MANFYTRFCAQIRLPDAATAAAVLAAHEAHRDDLETRLESPGFKLAAANSSGAEDTLLIMDEDGTCDLTATEEFVLQLAKDHKMTGLFKLQWAETCDRQRVDSFGGGIILIDLDAGVTKVSTSTHEIFRYYEANVPKPEDEYKPQAGFFTVAVALHDLALYSNAEGGCYCDVYDLAQEPDMPQPSVHATIASALAAKEMMDKALEPWNEGRPEVSSVNSIGRYVGYIHDGFPRSHPEKLPVYE